MSIKVQEGKHQELSHHGLIKLILEYALQNLRLPIIWTTFRDMQVEGEIKSLEYDKSPTASEREEETEEENKEEREEENEEEAQEEKEEEEEENEEEIEGETKEDIDEHSEEIEEENKEKDNNDKNGNEGIE